MDKVALKYTQYLNFGGSFLLGGLLNRATLFPFPEMCQTFISLVNSRACVKPVSKWPLDFKMSSLGAA